MHIVIALLTLLSAGAFWYFRMRDIGQAGGEIIDAAQRAKGKWNRKQFLKKADGSAITAVDDPALGAALMMVALCQERGPLTDTSEAAIKDELKRVMATEDVTEPYTYAKWATAQVVDANDVSRKLVKLWLDRLVESERHDLLAMLERVAAADGPLTQQQETVLRKLRERMGMTTRWQDGQR
jgi:uncharacterized tellurite resistance protein B-like protein